MILDDTLQVAADALTTAAQRAEMTGHDAPARRLFELVDETMALGEYFAACGLWYSRSRRRSILTFGWYLANDPDVRARRRALGLWIPHPELEDLAA